MDSEKSLDEIVQELLPALSPLTICLSHSWGGLEQVAVHDTQELANLGFSPKMVVLEGSPVHQNLNIEKVQPIMLSFRPRNYFDLRMKRAISSWVDSGVNLIHTHQTTLLGSLSPWLRAYPQVSLFASRHLMCNHNKQDWLHRFLYRRLDSLIVMSRALQENVLETHPLEKKQVQVIHLGLDFLKFNLKKSKPKEMREAWNISPSTLLIGVVGRIDPAKGQSVFIQAAAGLVQKFPDLDMKFLIVGEETLGSSSEYLSELKNMVSQFHMDDRVIFTGFEKEIPDVMSALDIFVMPSQRETFGLVAIEAMAMECPVIISGGGSSQEIVGQEGDHQLGAFGLIVRPNDPFDLQQQLIRLIEDSELRKAMGKRARKHVLKNYNHENRIKETLILYGESLKKRKATRKK